MNSKISKNKIKEIASEENLAENIVESIVRSQFEFAHDCMQSKEVVSIRFRHLGLLANVRTDKR